MNASLLIPALVALLVALALAAAGPWLRRPWLGALAAAAGVLAGWYWALGLVTASPRQLPERLPLLALALLLLGGIALPPIMRRRAGRLALGAGGALAVGWWMAGAPRSLADAAAALPVLAAVAALVLLLMRQPAPWSSAIAALSLLAGLALARLPGPGVALGAAALAAVLGALAAPARHGLAAALPVAGALAALAAVPVLARGAPADWAAAAAPVAALWMPALAGRATPGWRGPGLAVAAAAACLGAVWLLR